MHVLNDNIWVALAILVIGTARIVRLIAFDAYPPAAWLRVKWDDATHQSDWNKLLHCAYCLAPWVAILNLIAYELTLNLGEAYLSAWYLANLWLTVSYLAAILVAYDGDDA